MLRTSKERIYALMFVRCIFFAVIGFILLASFWGVGAWFNISFILAQKERLQGIIEMHFYLSLLLYALIYTLAIAFSLPGAVGLTLAGGMLFGGLVATPVIVISATIGATILFLFAQYTRMTLEKLGTSAAQFKQGFAKNAFYYLLFLRLTPLFPFWLVNIAAALLGVKLRMFILTTLIGIIPATTIFAFLGAGLNQAIETPSALLRPQILFALSGLGLLSLLPLLRKRKP